MVDGGNNRTNTKSIFTKDRSMKLAGEAFDWNLCGHRIYAVATMSYSQAREITMAYVFNAEKGVGEQRDLYPAQVKKLKKEMLAGTYTPTPVSVGLHPAHKKKLVIENGRFTLDVDPGEPLPQTDGQHRYEAVALIRKECVDRIKTPKNDTDKAEAEKLLKVIDSLPITMTIYFDGNPAEDFINLQASKAVDKAHMMGLRLIQGDAEPTAKMAMSTARLLHKTEESPFRDQIRFDSRGNLSLPITTLCAKSSSDIATSLIGASRVAEHFGEDERVIAHAIISGFRAIQNYKPVLQDFGKVLTPLRDGGKRGPATMYVGLGVCLLYRLLHEGRKIPSDTDMEWFAECAGETMNEGIAGGFSSARKRELMGRFAQKYFSDMAVTMHEGVPIELVRTLSASTFGLSKLPTIARKSSKAQQESTLVEAPESQEPPKGIEEAPVETTKQESPEAPKTEPKKPSAKATGKKTAPTSPSKNKGAKAEEKESREAKSSPTTKTSSKKKRGETTETVAAEPQSKLAGLPKDKAPWS